jgi:hypothetical protein
MLRNFRNFRNIFKLRGVINSDTPKRVSRFVTPFAKGVAFRTRYLLGMSLIILLYFCL